MMTSQDRPEFDWLEDALEHLSRKPDRSWSGSADWGKHMGELGSPCGNRFERALRPYLEVMFPGITPTPARGVLDRMGADFLVFDDDYDFPVVVQAKGFEVAASEMKHTQVRQVRKSVDSFLEHDSASTGFFVVVHNRDHRSPTFREGIAEVVDEAEADGTNIGRLLVWSRREFVNHLYSVLRRRLQKALATWDPEDVVTMPRFGRHTGALESVPFLKHELTFAPTKLAASRETDEKLGDPVEALRAVGDERTAVLIGEFGFGKTVAATRFYREREGAAFFIPGSRISGTMHSRKEFLVTCLEGLIDEHDILGTVGENRETTVRSLLRSPTKYLLTSQDVGATIIIDALDESTVLGRPEGFEQIFNWLNEVQVPTVLTLRTELWRRQLEEVRSVLNSSGGANLQNQGLTLIELVPWQDDQIAALTRQFADETDDAQEVARLEDFATLVDEGNYDAIYGDIPKRPLFLRLILERTRQQGLDEHRLGRNRLFEEWIRYKIQRDFEAPRQTGGTYGRAQIPDELPVGEVIEVAWHAMKTAASLMLDQAPEEEADEFVLTPTIEARELREEVRGWPEGLPVGGLPMVSLLIPTDKRNSVEPTRFQFAHRAFQEYFLARAIAEGSGQVNVDVESLPDSVREWMDELKECA